MRRWYDGLVGAGDFRRGLQRGEEADVGCEVTLLRDGVDKMTSAAPVRGATLSANSGLAIEDKFNCMIVRPLPSLWPVASPSVQQCWRSSPWDFRD